MIPAYHYVSSPTALERILEEGQVVPAVHRLSGKTIRGICDETLDLVLRMYAVGAPPEILTGIQALRELGEEAAAFYERIAKPAGAEFQTTKLQCVDILSGDGGKVFLAPWRWPLVAHGKKTGLVYDAEDLVRRGAGYRPKDLMFDYSEAVWEGLRGWRTVGEAKGAILRSLKAALKWEYHGEDALSGLRASAGRRPEITWEGPLPVEWAMEIWSDGARSR